MKIYKFIGIILLFSLCSFSLLVKNKTSIFINGKVTAITDGDTFKLLKADSTLTKVRLANIDCPERKQPFSKRAKQFASDAIFGKNVEVQVLKKDRYGRFIANVIYDDDKNLSKELLKAGYAWHYVKYSNDSTLQKLEDKAKTDKIGLWQDPNAVAPWEWRSHKKKKIKQ